MKKDFVKKNKRYKSKPRSSRAKWFGAMFAMIIVGGAGFWFIQQKKQSILSPAISAYAERTQLWMAERKNRLQDNLKKVKRVAISDDELPPIQFEFYTALPNMKMNIADATEAANKTTTKKLASNTTIFDADKLQQALSEELNQHQK